MASTLSTLSRELADLVDRAAPLVVQVGARHRRPSSGLIFGPDLVVTADHVLDGDEHVHVRSEDRRLDGEVVGRDAGSDLAVVRVAGLGGSEPPKAAQVRPGQLVIAISRTPTAAGIAAGLGVIAAVGGPLRTGRGAVLPQVVRTSAAIYPGSSGGAILDVEGRVIGMTTSGLLRGIPTAIPGPQLWEIAEALATDRRVKRAYLGVSVQPVRFPAPGPEDDDGGLLVTGMARDGAARSGGLLIGDVIVAVGGVRLEHADDLQDYLARIEAGSAITLGIVRGGQRNELSVVTGIR